jgi:hypothetical protein
MGPQNCCKGKQPDATIRHFRALLENTQDTMHHGAIWSNAEKLFNDKSCKKMYILDEQLHAIELCA